MRRQARPRGGPGPTVVGLAAILLLAAAAAGPAQADEDQPEALTPDVELLGSDAARLLEINAALMAEVVTLRAEVETLRVERAAAQGRLEKLEGRLQAAELFLSESERQRRELSEKLAALEQGQPDAGEPVVASLRPGDAPDPVAIMAMVNAWAAAWSERRVADHLSFYAEGFDPPGEVDREAWESVRREEILAATPFGVDVALLDLRALASDRAEIELLRSLGADGDSDSALLTLELVEQSGSWKIVGERAE